MPSEDSIRDIVCNEVCLSMDTINPPDGNQQPTSLSQVQNLEENIVASYVKVDPSNNNAKQSTQSQLSSKNAQGKGSGHARQADTVRVKNGSSRQLNDPYTTWFHKIRKSIILPLLSLLSDSPGCWASLPSLRPPSEISSTYKSKTSVEEFAFKISSPTVHKTQISTPGYMS